MLLWYAHRNTERDLYVSTAEVQKYLKKILKKYLQMSVIICIFVLQ